MIGRRAAANVVGSSAAVAGRRTDFKTLFDFLAPRTPTSSLKENLLVFFATPRPFHKGGWRGRFSQDLNI
jgi:hypothetical protein